VGNSGIPTTPNMQIKMMMAMRINFHLRSELMLAG
jgi:hypothetical protein